MIITHNSPWLPLGGKLSAKPTDEGFYHWQRTYPLIRRSLRSRHLLPKEKARRYAGLYILKGIRAKTNMAPQRKVTAYGAGGGGGLQLYGRI